MKYKKSNILNRIKESSRFKALENIYNNHKEALLYLFFGGITFFLNIFLFFSIDKAFGLNELINNIICWIICVLFQFFTNRTWVFNGHVDTPAEFIKQMTTFFMGRISTLIVEEIILGIFVIWLNFNTTVVKLLAQVVVIILNYIISKLIVFRNNK